MPLDPTDLLPALRPASWLRHRGLSDDGFCDTIASISLSRDLSATFTCGGADISYRGLSELHLSAHGAWELSASNLIERARTPEGINVRTRPAHHLLGAGAAGLQVALPGAPATSWLAHPRTFRILDDHLAELLGGPVVWRYLPADGLVAVGKGGVDKHPPEAVYQRHGFPVAVSTRTQVAAPA
ncbi:MAG: hypothetical protein Q4G50_02555 [Corynebacterium sp.]|uniref:hypothetical protein n=1 Tax=Corynebacterium sp. TaxID=1720 RepID=UPI0026DFFDE1|nr:hypothetical protein [Corynebacterium sp.]MDO5668865.1 hypothetical protein [Corynebacterium sp.]